MVRAAREGVPLRAVAARFRVALSTVQRWVRRASKQRLDRVDWEDRPCGASAPVNRTPRDREDLILATRQQLREESDLGEYGAVAIRRELERRKVAPLPSLRTIGYILKRRGVLDSRQRVRRPAPRPGWYLPDVVKGRAELDSFDIVEGLVIKDGPGVEVFNGVSLHGGLVASWPRTPAVTAEFVTGAVVEHWRAHGLPTYAQFDNDPIFQGAQAHPDTIGRVIRTCLSLGVVPVFAPPRETGFQAAIEGYNGRWQAKVWARFHHPSLDALQGCSDRYVAAHRARSAARIEAAPARRPFPREWKLDLQAHPRGRIVFIRRTDEKGRVQLLGHSFVVDAQWPNRLVRADLDLTKGRIRFYTLRRRAPDQQPLVAEVAHKLPERKFHE
jgi:hypothetical protein